MGVQLPAPLVACVFLLSFVAYYLCGYPIFDNPDVPWHLAAGDFIVANGIPRYDPWSYTAGEVRWLNIEWLWDAGISLIHSIFGPLGLYAFTCTLAAVNLAALASSLKARGQVSDGYIVLMCALAWLVQLAILYPYPQLLTLLFACWFHRMLHSHRRDGLLDARLVLGMVVLMALWANVHGGFLVGFILLATYGIEAYEQRNWKWLVAGCKLAALCAVAVLANPFGVYAYHGVLAALGFESHITPYLADWQAFSFGHELNFTLPLVFFILTSNVRDGNIRLADKLLAFAWLLAALYSRRNFALFIILAAPYFSYCLQEFARAVQRAQFKSGDDIFHDSSRRRFVFAAAIVWVALVLPPTRVALVPQEKLALDPYGVAALVELTAKEYPATRFLNDYNLGGYLAYHGGGKWPLFVDGRAGTVYPDVVLEDAVAFGLAAPASDELFARYGASGVVALKGHAYLRKIAAQPKEWKQIFDNGQVVAFVRTNGN